MRHGWRRAKKKRKGCHQLAQKHNSRLVASLTDFHKAQCFFMLATNIAALVVARRGGLDPQSLQQIYNTFAFLKLIAVNGYLPITFTMLNLHIVGLLSWYLILLSVLTVALSIGTLATVGTFSPSQSDMANLASLAKAGGPASCDSTNPGVYCYQSEYYSYYYSGYGMDASSIDDDAFSMLGFCLFIMVLLVGHKSRIINRRPVQRIGRWILTILTSCKVRLVAMLRQSGLHRQFQRLSAQSKSMAMACWSYISRLFDEFCVFINRPGLHRWTSLFAAQWDKLKASRTWRLCTENAAHMWLDLEYWIKTVGYKSLAKMALQVVIFLLFLLWYCELFYIFLNDLAWFATNQVYSKTWNFGQVVAITVWAPPICEFIHLELRQSDPISN